MHERNSSRPSTFWAIELQRAHWCKSWYVSAVPSDAQLYNAPEFDGASPTVLPLANLQAQLLCACGHSGVGPVGLPLSHLKTQLLALAACEHAVSSYIILHP